MIKQDKTKEQPAVEKRVAELQTPETQNERKGLRIQEALEYAESIINTVREPLIILDNDLRVVTASRSFYEFFKVGPEETEGQLIYDLGNKQWDIPKLREMMETILPEKATFDSYEVEHPFATIGRRTMLLNARQIQRVLGKERMILLAIEDITDRKRLDNLLKEAEGRYRHVFETASDGILLFEKSEGKITHANTAAGKMLGYSLEESVGKKLQDIGIVDIDNFQTLMQILDETGITNYTDVSIETKSGEHIDTDIYLANRSTLVQCNIRDVSQRKQVATELNESKALFEAVVENVPLMIFLKEATDLRFVIFNRAGEELLGYDRRDLIGKNSLDLFPPDQAAHFMAKDREVLDGVAGMMDILEEPILTAGKGQRILHTRKVCIRGPDGATKFLLGISEDITSRMHAEEELKQTMEKLSKSLMGTIQALSSMVETRDPYTSGHQRRVSNLARAIAQEMGLSSDMVDTIRMAGIIHDIGKISVPAEILVKPGKISDIEMSLIKVHSQSGYDTLKDVGLPYPIAEIVLQHHEKLDGSGYPQGLKNGQILLEAQIITVADVVEAMASHRPYRPALGIEIALEEIEKNKGILYDAKVVDTCLKLFREKGFSFE